MRKTTLIISFIVFLIYSVYFTTVIPSRTVAVKSTSIARHEISLDKRYENTYVNKVFKDNILLTLAYMDGRVRSKSDVNWDNIEKTGSYKLVLRPGDIFAFHDLTLPLYKNKHIITTNAHFNTYEGFQSDGYLAGDGVCHLASLINWAAKDAGLSVLAPTNHNFANIPEIPKNEGVAIYSTPGQPDASASQNLYIENTLNKTVVFDFDYKNDILSLAVSKAN